MIGLPPDDDKTRLCAFSVMGQILVYVFAIPLLAGVWPELKMTPGAGGSHRRPYRRFFPFLHP